MSVVKVIEVLSQSDQSWDDAAHRAIDEAAKSVKNIKSIYNKEIKADVENNRITNYQINGKISFLVD